MTFDYATAEKETVACNLCGGYETKVVATTDRYGLDVTTVRCVGCGLRYQNPRLTAEASAAFYADGYRPLLSKFYQRAITPESIESDQWTYAAQVSSLLEPYVKRGGTVLDIGGSTGIVAQMFHIRYGTDAIVIDPAVSEIARVRGSRVVQASAEDLPDLPPADLALMCRTVDHLRDPRGVLEKLRASCQMLFIDAVNVDASPREKRYKLDHPYAFTPKTLAAMVEKAGWQIHKTWVRHAMASFCYLCVPRKDVTHGENQ